MYNWKKHWAIKTQFEKLYTDIPKQAGIYLWTRVEGDITYFYVGQAKNLFNRRFDYYKIQTGLGYPTRHFEASLKKHKDWNFQVIETCPEGLLDQQEQYWIKHYNALPNHITRNDLLAGNDIVKSNYHRIEQIKNKQFKAFQQCFKYLNIEQPGFGLVIGFKTTKKGIPTALSKKYYSKLLELLGIKEKNNEKIQKPL